MVRASDHVARVADSLIQIEIELRQLDVWESRPPSRDALQSTQPFGIDRLEFTQWLQFVFIARMKALIERGQPLPEMSGMAPMAEEYFSARKESGRNLIEALADMDRLLSDRG